MSSKYPERLNWNSFLSPEEQRKILNTCIGEILPKHYQHCAYHNFETPILNLETALRAVKGWHPTKFLSGLLLFGPAGSGKSHLAAAKVRDMMLNVYYPYMSMKALPIKWYDARALYGMYIAAMKGNHDVKLSDLNTVLREIPLLVLDDLGHEAETESSIQFFQNILCHRYNDESHFIITTNLLLVGEPSFEKRYGRHIISRLNENCEFVYVNSPKDFRLILRAGKQKRAEEEK